jgi:hypothetical protein
MVNLWGDHTHSKFQNGRKNNKGSARAGGSSALACFSFPQMDLRCIIIRTTSLVQSFPKSQKGANKDAFVGGKADFPTSIIHRFMKRFPRGRRYGQGINHQSNEYSRQDRDKRVVMEVGKG